MNLKQKLEYHYKAFDKSQISPDPLQFLHLYKDKKDIEVIGFIASVFAYGNVKQIINTLNKILTAANNQPYNFIMNFKDLKRNDGLKNLKHRFYTTEDIIVLFFVMNDILEKYGSIKKLFLKYYTEDGPGIKNALNDFSIHLLQMAQAKTGATKITRGIRFMFPLPELGSACKRMNLFLRWMVRKDELDFGIWGDKISKAELIIPVDTHVARVCKILKLTTLKNVSWNMAEEITANLKKLDADDPVKYDFAICHIGMRKLEI